MRKKQRKNEERNSSHKNIESFFFAYQESPGGISPVDVRKKEEKEKKKKRRKKRRKIPFSKSVHRFSITGSYTLAASTPLFFFFFLHLYTT